MDSTEWMALLIVALTALLFLYFIFRGKTKSGCCDKGCEIKKLKKEE